MEEQRFRRRPESGIPREEWHPTLLHPDGTPTKVGNHIWLFAVNTDRSDPIHLLAREALTKGDAHAFLAAIDALREASPEHLQADPEVEERYERATFQARLLAAGASGSQIDEHLRRRGDPDSVRDYLNRGFSVVNGRVRLAPKPRRKPLPEQYARELEKHYGTVSTQG